MTDKIYELRCAKMWLDDDGIVHLVFLPGAEVALSDAKEIGLALQVVCMGKKRPLFTDSRFLKKMDRDARIYGVSEEVVKWCSAGALLNTPIVRMMGTLYSHLNIPPFEMRYFSSESEALTWLKGFLEEVRE